jgi:GDP/UDP-N,N'-diacetylbacillosamine 2-epimerase (hydrolysing)
LITFHPATLERRETPEMQFRILLKAVSSFKNTSFVISKSNADAGGDKINKLIDEFSEQNKNTLTSYSFGQLNYLSLMQIADVIIGNSSSGIIEAPSLNTETVNVGSRQKGRMSAESVIQSGITEKEIVKAISKALKLKNKKAFKNPYDNGSSSEKIVTTLEKLNFERLLPKKFNDLS